MAAEISPKIKELIAATLAARTNAYCPYSNFHVGAAVLCQDGTIFSGCNVENASYSLCICAERTAITAAVSAGHRNFQAIGVCCDIKDDFKASCGACRQFIAEFGMDVDMYMIKPSGEWKKVPFHPLLPNAFTPAALNQERQAIKK